MLLVTHQSLRINGKALLDSTYKNNINMDINKSIYRLSAVIKSNFDK